MVPLWGLLVYDLSRKRSYVFVFGKSGIPTTRVEQYDVNLNLLLTCSCIGDSRLEFMYGAMRPSTWSFSQFCNGTSNIHQLLASQQQVEPLVKH
jgi:hypothetical protein